MWGGAMEIELKITVDNLITIFELFGASGVEGL
jgi:hypothetical protein